MLKCSDLQIARDTWTYSGGGRAIDYMVIEPWTFVLKSRFFLRRHLLASVLSALFSRLDRNG